MASLPSDTYPDNGDIGFTCLHDLFLKSAVLYPDNLAIVLDEESISYSELNAFACQIANDLLDCGIKVGDRVGLYLQKSINLYAAILGIIAASN